MDRNPRTVLYLGHTAQLGGAEIGLLRFLQALDQTVVYPIVAISEDGPLAIQLRKAGIEVHIFPLARTLREVRKDTLTIAGLGSQLKQTVHLLRYAHELARFARAKHINIIETNTMKAHIFGGIAGRLAGIPVVWHLHDYVHESYLPKPAVLAMRLLARLLPTRIVACSHSVLKQVRLPCGSRKGVVIPYRLPPADLAAYERRERPIFKGGQRATIGIVGRICPWKGQHVFLRAAEKLISWGHDVRFVIIGSALFGEEAYEAALRRFADTSGLEEHVTFKGFRDDIPAELANLDVLVHASTSPEPFGLVIIEGMAAGLPIIGTDAGGVAETIKHGVTGLLVPMGDAAALAHELDMLLQDTVWAKQLGEAGFTHVRQHYTMDKSIETAEKVYADCLS